MKMTLDYHLHPLGTQCQQYLSCYLPDFDQTLKVGSWEHLEQALTVTIISSKWLGIDNLKIIWCLFIDNKNVGRRKKEEGRRRNGTYIQLPVGQASSFKKLLVGVVGFMITILWLFGDYIEDYWK